MIEILNIFYLFLISGIIFSFPLHNTYLKKKFSLTTLNLFEIYSLNTLIILTFFFIFSFFGININLIFFSILFFSLINFFYIDWKLFFNNFYLLIFFSLFYLVFSTEISTYPYLEWDAAVNWIFKTLNFKDNHSFQNLENVPGILGYPHLGTYLWAFFWEISFIDHEYTGRLSFIFIYLLIFFSIIERLKINHFFKIIFLIFLIVISFDRILINGYQEPLMFSLCSIFIMLLTQIHSSKNNFLIFLFMLICANLILWVKNEGMFFLMFLSIFILFKKQIENKYKLFLISFFIFLIFFKKYIFIYLFGNITFGWQGYEFLPINALFSFEILQRLPLLLFQVLINFIKYPIYIVFILCFLMILIREKKISSSLDFLLFFLINITMSVSIFYCTNDPNWMHHAKVGLDRMLYQTSGVYLFYIVNYLKNLKLINFRFNS
jgi:hypothetical protein